MQLFYTTSLPEWGRACDVTLLCSLSVFSVGRYLAPLPFQSWAMLVTVRALVHLRYFLKAAVLHHFPSGIIGIRPSSFMKFAVWHRWWTRIVDGGQ